MKYIFAKSIGNLKLSFQTFDEPSTNSLTGSEENVVTQNKDCKQFIAMS